MNEHDRIRELAVQAGFKVWKDGRITAADNHVSGSATASLERFYQLVVEQTRRNDNDLHPQPAAQS